MGDHARCADLLRDLFREKGISATVSTEPPLVRSPYEPLDMVCPHGVLFYAEPTGEQIAEWVRDGVA